LLYPNLIFYLKKNIDRGFRDISLFEIGPTFYGKEPGEQLTVIGALRSGKAIRSNWLEKDRNIDVYDSKRDLVQTLVEAGFNKEKLYFVDQTPSYYHPGKSGKVYLSKTDKNPIAFFGEIHPNIIKNLEINTDSLVCFEIYLDHINETTRKLRERKSSFQYSDYQKSERDFAFIVDKKIKVQDLVNIISSVDKNLIKSVNVFDVYEGENIPSDKKSIALNVNIQSSDKALKENDLDNISNLIISEVEKRSGAKIRS